MALIVAGAPGSQRRDHVHTLLKLVQSHLPNTPSVAARRKRRRVDIPSSPVVTTAIPSYSLDMAPSIEEYMSDHGDKPFIIKGGIHHWPACQKWIDLDYLRQIAGPGRVVPVEIGGKYTQETWSQSIMSFSTFLDALELDHPDTLYLAQHDLMRQLPELEDDIVVPDYVWTAPADQDYVPPASEKGYLVNAWLGPAGTNSPAHTDPYYNAYGQVVGRKLIWLAPPAAIAGLYPFSQADGSESAAEQYMSNTSRLDVLSTCFPGEEQIDLAACPKFKLAQAQSMQAVLDPGDLLVMPPGWWHALRSLDVSFSVSLWY